MRLEVQWKWGGEVAFQMNNYQLANKNLIIIPLEINGRVKKIVE
jgi:hypothetical protein